jgi:hypothetical protein
MKMTDVTWEDGPWLVEIKYVVHVAGCGADTAQRAALALVSGQDVLKHDESWPPELEVMSRRSTVHPANEEPFDVDHLVKEIQGE